MITCVLEIETESCGCMGPDIVLWHLCFLTLAIQWLHEESLISPDSHYPWVGPQRSVLLTTIKKVRMYSIIQGREREGAERGIIAIDTAAEEVRVTRASVVGMGQFKGWWRREQTAVLESV